MQIHSSISGENNFVSMHQEFEWRKEYERRYQIQDQKNGLFVF